MTEKNDMGSSSAEHKTTKKVKLVRNRSGHKVELFINGEVVIFLPGNVVEVPTNVEIPNGLGLYVR